MKKYLTIIWVLLFLIVPPISFAHPGRTDSYGCHTCRTNCPSWGLSSGEYHCHNAKALPQPLSPIKSTKGIGGGAGYTSPAPEYKAPIINSEKLPKSQAESVISNNEVKSNFWRSILSWLGW